MPVSKKIRIPTLRGPTPLIFAILCEQTGIVKYLIEKKQARLDIAIDGLLPIHFACMVGIKEIVELILNREPAYLNSKSAIGYTPLHIACANEHLQLVLMLIKQGATISSSIAQNGNTPLHVAMRNSDTKIAEVIIAADDQVLEIKNRQGQWAIDIAKMFQNEKMVAFILNILRGEVDVPIFEVLYVKYNEGLESREVMADVVERLSRKLEKIEASMPAFEEEEEGC